MSSEKSRPIPLVTPMGLCYRHSQWETIPAPLWSESPYYQDSRNLLKAVGYTVVSNLGSVEIGMLIYWGNMDAAKRQQDKQVVAEFPYVLLFEFANRMANKVVYIGSFQDLVALIGIDVWTTGRLSTDRVRLPRPVIEPERDSEEER